MNEDSSGGPDLPAAAAAAAYGSRAIPNSQTSAAYAHRPEAKTDSPLDLKWSREVMQFGFVGIPDLLLRHMATLGLTPTELVLLLQLARYWWTYEQLPFPSKHALARAMGASDKNVQKVLGSLERKGFLIRIQRRRESDRSHTNLYDLEPLVEKLQELAGKEAAARWVAENVIPRHPAQRP